MLLSLLFFNISVRGQELSGLRDQDPVSLQGSLSLGMSFNKIEGIDRRQPPFSYTLSGNPTLRIYGFELPFGFFFSNYQRNFTQPFNKFGVSPTYKKIKLHLGYRNVNFSPFTLSGRTFLGAGIEMNPGLFRFGAVYGRFQKAILEDTTFLNGEMDRTLQPSFRRTGYSVKLGLGDDRNHFDVILLKGQDDALSLVTSPTKAEISPEENAALGISSQFTLLKKLTWKTDIGASAFTRDTEQEAIDVGDLGSYQFVTSLITPRISTQLFFAGESSLQWSGSWYSLQLQYRRIDPGYKTMGSYYLQTDVEHYLIGASARTSKNTLMVRGSIGRQRDNIKASRLTQTNRTIGQFYLTWQPAAWVGADIQYSNFGITQTPGLKSISDTTLLRNINQNLVVTPRLLFQTGDFSHMVNGMYNYSDLDDKSDNVQNLTEMRSVASNGNYSLTWQPAGLTLSAGFNRVRSKISLGETISEGLNAGVSKSLMKGRLQIRAAFTANKNRFEGNPYGSTSRINGSIQYRQGQNHLFRLDLYRLTNESDQAMISKSFTESVARITYTYRFNTQKKKAS